MDEPFAALDALTRRQMQEVDDFGPELFERIGGLGRCGRRQLDRRDFPVQRKRDVFGNGERRERREVL